MSGIEALLCQEPWEDGSLGREAKYVARAPLAAENDLDEALGLQPVSIRLPRQLIDQFKLIAHFHGVGYQPLMRDVLTRFVPGALQEILQAQQAQAQKAAQQAKPAKAPHPFGPSPPTHPHPFGLSLSKPPSRPCPSSLQPCCTDHASA